MRTWLTVYVIILISAAQTVVAASKGSSPSATTPKGTKLYTKFSLFHEDYRHRTTNYRKGLLVPANTEVVFVRARKEEIVVTLPNGQNLRIENVQEYSGENIDGIFSRTFSLEQIDLEGFTEEERNAIQAGEVKIGMSKGAVLVAMGYPPKHKTPSLQTDQWRYWRNRFGTFLVIFEDGKVSRIRE